MSARRRWLSLLVCVLSPLSVAADELPPRAVARLGDYRFYHGYVKHASMTADGRWLASAGQTTVLIWDAKTGRRQRELEAPNPVACLAFSPDGAALAVGCGLNGKDLAVILFDPATGKRLNKFTGFFKSITGVQFSADGKRLYVSELEGIVSAWDTDTGKLLHSWLPPQPPHDNDRKERSEDVHQGILSPDSQLVVWLVEEIKEQRPRSGCCNVLRVCDADSNKLLYEKRDEQVDFANVVFSADGKRYAAADADLVVWDARSGKEVRRQQMTSKSSRVVALSADGCLAAVDTYSRLQLWNLQTGKRLHDLCSIQYWTALADHSAAFTANGKTFMMTDWSILRLWDTASGQELLATPGHRQQIEALNFSPDGKTLVSFSLDLACRWDVSRGKETDRLNLLQPMSQTRNVEARSPDGRLFLDQVPLLHLRIRGRAVADQAKSYQLRLREIATGRVVRELEGKPPNWVRGMFSEDGSRVMTEVYLKQGAIQEPPELLYQVYDVATGKQLGRIRAEHATYFSAFSGDGRSIAWLDEDNRIHVHDATTGRLLQTIQLPEKRLSLFPPHPLVFSPDGTYLALIPTRPFGVGLRPRTPQPVHIYHVPTGREVGSVKLDDTTKLFRFSPDNRLLAVTELFQERIRLIEIATGKARAQFDGHRADTRCLAFSPDSTLLASGGNDNVVYLWDVTGAGTKGRADEIGSPEELASWWKSLANADAEPAIQALAALLRRPERSVPFLKERLRPVEPVDAKRVARLIAALNDDAFEKREAASRGFAQLGEQTETALQQALQNKPSPEAKRRIDELMDKLDPWKLPPETLQNIRAVEALEHIGTPEARKLLETLANGAPEARLTREAKASLKRLEK